MVIGGGEQKGTAMGGGTFWGLCKLLTHLNGFEEMIELSKLGNPKNVDMLVGDIYGGDYSGGMSYLVCVCVCVCVYVCVFRDVYYVLVCSWAAQ